MKNKLAIIGAGGHGKVCADVAHLMNEWEKIVFLDSNKVGETILGFHVIDSSDNWSTYIEDYDFFIAIGDNKNREKVQNELFASDATIKTLIHPTAIIAGDVKVENGTLITARVVVNPSTTIGQGVILNTGCTIDHDNIIEDFVHISPGANLAGTVEVGSRSWIGIGSIVKNNLSICEDVIVGAGSVVVKDINENGTYIGVPIKKMN